MATPETVPQNIQYLQQVSAYIFPKPWPEKKWKMTLTSCSVETSDTVRPTVRKREWSTTQKRISKEK